MPGHSLSTPLVDEVPTTASELRPWGEPRALYVHVPFCRHRCGYCDFTLVAGRDDLIERYLQSLEKELAFSLPEPVEIDMLFFGGGTPSHLNPNQLASLFQLVLKHVRPTENLEFSIEANPLDVTADRLAGLRNFGVNRVSLGVQSFEDAELRILERDHTGDEARTAVEHTAKVIPNVGIDLIFGAPGQSLESWRRSLHAAVELERHKFAQRILIQLSVAEGSNDGGVGAGEHGRDT